MIGILQFNNRIYHKRDGKKDYQSISDGFKKVLSELNQPWEYCTYRSIDRYDHVLVSLHSHHDIFNLINNTSRYHKTKIHIGGPACNNIRPIIPFIDTANFGRCDNGKINKIIDGEIISSVWRKELDPEFDGEYIVDHSSIDGLGENEQSFGCPKKCAFCFYSHWNGFTCKSNNLNYQSGYSFHEDYFQNLDWHSCIRGGVTALDGCNEETRFKVNKYITKQDIINKLLESNNINTKTQLRLKVYSIVGYPWENIDSIKQLDLVDAAKEISNKIKNKINIKLHFSHFIPYQKTPLWNVAFNEANYRQYCIDNGLLYQDSNIAIWSSWQWTSSPAQAAQAMICQRAGNTETHHIVRIASKEFQRLNSSKQLHTLKTMLPDCFNEQHKETLHNIKTQGGSWIQDMC